jgi:hypothetical protein
LDVGDQHVGGLPLAPCRASLPLLAWITSSPSTPSASTTNSLNAESDADNRRAVADQLFDVGGNAPTATATGWRQLDDR